MSLKIVIDTNVWVKYAANGKISRLVKIIFDNNLEVYCNGQILAELHRTLSKPKVITDNAVDVDEIIDLVKMITIFVASHTRYVLSPDLKDNFLFDTCIQHQCILLITEERALCEMINPPVMIKNLGGFKENFS